MVSPVSWPTCFMSNTTKWIWIQLKPNVSNKLNFCLVSTQKIWNYAKLRFKFIMTSNPSIKWTVLSLKSTGNDIRKKFSNLLITYYVSCFGYFPGVWLLLNADVSEHSIFSIFKGWIWSVKYHIQPLKMEQIECSETSAFNNNQTPGKYPKDYTQYSKHGESFKSEY